MCELFGMSSLRPSTVNFSLNAFATHGGARYGNNSGWGIAFYIDRDAFLIKEPEPASDSPWVQFIASQNVESPCVIAHVRLATVGTPTLRNTHPFRRALGGRTHIFAHNGTLKGIRDAYQLADLSHHPIGETDSELAFCILMERLQPLWRLKAEVPPLAERMAVFAEFAAEMLTRGPANFLYSDGETLFAHGHRRVYEVDGKLTDPRPPGLSIRNCLRWTVTPEPHCEGVKLQLADQQAVLVASVPLDDDGWVALDEGTAIAIEAGKERMRVSTL